MKKQKLPMTAARLTQTFERRTFLLGAIQGGVGLLLAGRLGYLAVAQNAKYRAASESNRVNLSLIPPRRGWLIDREGKALASNRADFRVDLIPDRLVDADATLATLKGLLNLPDDHVADIKDKIDKSRGFQPVEVASKLDWDTFAAVSVRLPELPGVIPQRGFSRYYPAGAAVGHLVGYVGPASADDYVREHNPLLITPGFKIGKDGLEKTFEVRLRGVPGARRVEATASGRVVRELGTREDVPGQPVQLTVHAGLQEYAARRMGLESGSVVVMDCQTGDVLAMGSSPRALAQQSAARALSAGIDGQTDGGAGVSRGRARSACRGQLRRGLARGQPRVPLLEPPRPWQHRHDEGHLSVVRCLFLPLRAADRHGHDRGDDAADGAGRRISDALCRAIVRHGARSRVETAQVPQGMGGL
jgi:cell division protein FtsI/penicillin-binding protein 2